MATTSEPAIATSSPPSSASLLSIRNVAKDFGKNIVLRDISLEIAEGEFLTILGESGSGKTTLLRILAGFEQSTSGEVWMSGERLDTEPPYRRRVNTVFQHYALFPHMTVEQNVGYGLAIANVPPPKFSRAWPRRWPRSRCPPAPSRSPRKSAADSSNASRSPARW